MNPLGLVVTFAIIFGIWALIISIIVIAVIDEKKRAGAFRAFSEANNFTHRRKIRSEGVLGLPQIELFTRGRRKWLNNAMAGEVAGSEVRVLDYRYAFWTDKHAPMYEQTVVAIRLNETVLPEFMLARRDYFSQKSEGFGGGDISFDAAPGFSERYRLQGSDEDAIRALFDARVIDAYMERLDCNVEVRGEWLFVFEAGKEIEPEQLQDRIEVVLGFTCELTGAMRGDGLK